MEKRKKGGREGREDKRVGLAKGWKGKREGRAIRDRRGDKKKRV